MLVAEKKEAVFLQDYQSPSYRVETVALRFELGEESTIVRAGLSMRRYGKTRPDAPLVLDGQGFELLILRIDGRTLAESEYLVDAESLTIATVPESFTLEVETRLQPHKNTSLEGLYRSSGNFCTQCEAQGFRRITYYPDRPDVMARFTTTIVADKRRCPVLLANGNLVDTGH